MLTFFKNVTKIEKPVIISGIVVLVFSFILLLVSIFEFGIGVSNCVTNMTPFQKGEVFFHDPSHYEIHYVARMWAFEPAEVTVPTHAKVDIYLTSADITHGFEIPATDINMMAIPGAINYQRVTFNHPGTYSIICHEYCGTGHQNMATVIRVEEPGFFPPHLPTMQTTPQTESTSGLRIMQQKGCIACHSIDGSTSTGPTFKGLWQRKEILSDGTIVRVDENYIRESILEPQAKTVKGYQPIMPKVPITESELTELISYIKTLK